MAAVKLAIFGSCVSRDPFAFCPSDAFEIGTYVGRNSFIGIQDPPVAFEPDWYADLSRFEARCVAHDLGKTAVRAIKESKADVLLLDFIDERFDLTVIGRTKLSKTKHVHSPGFVNSYGGDLAQLSRLSPIATSLWEKGCDRFLTEVSAVFPPERIVLNASIWAPCLRGEAGPIAFGEPYATLIPEHNAILEKYFAYVRRRLPGIREFSPGPDILYADPNHAWSKEPFHYVKDYYEAFMRFMTDAYVAPVPKSA